MGLLSFFKRDASTASAKPVSDARDAVQQLRVRARRRLIGAAVLVAVAVIGFPLLFETQPRPIPVDLPIDIPRKEGAPALPIPAPQAQPATAASLPSEAGLPTTAEVIEPHGRSAGGVPLTTPAPAPVAAAEPVPVAPKPAEKSAEKPAEKLADKAKAKTEAASQVKSQEAARVQALLEGKPAQKKADKVPDSGDRFVVQVGAYADAKAAQDVRAKLERMGLKTYTQAVETADGRRIRVRVGPFSARDEADKVSAKVRAAGLSTAVLTL